MLYAASSARHLLDSHMPLLRALRGAGWDITLACRGASAFAGTFDALEIPFTKSMLAPANLKALGALRDAMRGGRYDVISTHTALAGALARAAFAISGGRNRAVCVHTAHGYLFGRGTPLSGRLTYPFEYLAGRVTDAVIVMNGEDAGYARRLVKRGGRVITVKGMGYDAERYRPAPPGERAALREALGLPGGVLLFCAAEFSPRKNHAALIGAMPRVLSVCPGARLLLAGDGRGLDDAAHQVRRLGLGDRVLFLGYVPDTAPYLRACDGAVSASLSEGLPLGVLEALACGVPTALSRVKGHVDMPGIADGLLFDPGNPDDIARACALLIETALRGFAPPAGLEYYAAPAAASALLEIYEGIRDARNARHAPAQSPL